MNRDGRSGVSNSVFALTVLVLIVIASSGFLLYATRPAMTETMTNTMTEMMTAGSSAVSFVPAHGAMIGAAYLVTAPLGNGSYALAIYANDLESPAMGDYIVEAAQNSGQMATAPIAGGNVTLSEFDADGRGNGQFFIILHGNPAASYESVSLYFVPGMEMQSATEVATAPL